MKVECIEWIDKEVKEAILKVVSEANILNCFSCPCNYKKGDLVNEPLECLDVRDIIMCYKPGYNIQKLEGTFKYELRGVLVDKINGFMKVRGFCLHFDSTQIPNDIENGMFIQMIVSRIDIWWLLEIESQVMRISV